MKSFTASSSKSIIVQPWDLVFAFGKSVTVLCASWPCLFNLNCNSNAVKLVTDINKSLFNLATYFYFSLDSQLPDVV